MPEKFTISSSFQSHSEFTLNISLNPHNLSELVTAANHYSHSYIKDSMISRGFLFILF